MLKLIGKFRNAAGPSTEPSKKEIRRQARELVKEIDNHPLFKIRKASSDDYRLGENTVEQQFDYKVRSIIRDALNGGFNLGSQTGHFLEKAYEYQTQAETIASGFSNLFTSAEELSKRLENVRERFDMLNDAFPLPDLAAEFYKRLELEIKSEASRGYDPAKIVAHIRKRYGLPETAPEEAPQLFALDNPAVPAISR